MIDTVMSGNTLKSAAYAFMEYLYAYEQTETPVEMLGIAECFEDDTEEDAKYYANLGMSVALVSQGECEDEFGISAVTSLESQLLHGGCKVMAPFGELKWKYISDQPALPQPEPANLGGYYYLIARIYFWIAMPPLSTWWLHVYMQ